MATNSSKDINRYIAYGLCSFLLLFLLFGISGGWGNISTYQLIIQFVFAVVSFLYIANRRLSSTNKIFVNTFLFQISLASILKLMFLNFEDCEFGPSAADSIGYFDYGLRGSRMTLDKFQDMLSDTSWGGIDDCGYLYYLRFLFGIFPDVMVPFVAIFLNSIYISVAALALYKTLLILVPEKKQIAITVVGVFSSFLFFVNSSAVGLKEDLFVPIIIVSVYYYVSYRINRKLLTLFLCVFFTLMTVFFRTAVTAILLTVFIADILTNQKNKKIVIYSFVIALLFLPFVLHIICDYILGISLDDILAVAQKRNDIADGANSSSKQIGNILASVVGPFPTFVDPIDSIFYSFSSMVKMLLNLPVLYAIFTIIKKFDYRYYFAAFIYLIGIIFTIISGTGLDMRYQIPFIGAYFILLFYFVSELRVGKLIYIIYFVTCLGIVVMYNVTK